MKKTSGEPLITIIIPVYKVEKYLDKCVKSVINQTYKNLEIILVDDGSPDNCPKMCDDYAKKDSRIKVIHKKNGGLSDARNKGIKIAKGEYIGFVDSDDWIDKDMYQHLFNLIEKYDADISVCNLIRATKEKYDSVKNEEFINEYSQEEYLKRYFKIGYQTIEYYAVNKLYKRELLNSKQYPDGFTSEDVFGTLKTVLKASKIVKTNMVFYYYRYNENSITGSFSKKDFDLIYIWDMVVNYTKKNANRYYNYAVFNRKRIDYTLLTRMAFNIKYGNIIKKYRYEYELCYNNLKKNWKELIKSNITFLRKISLLMIVLNYRLFCFLAYNFNLMRRKK